MADEFQEWFRFRVLPAIWRLGQQHFREGANDWFSKKLYDGLCRAVQYDQRSTIPMFLISQDSDPRHSMLDFGGHSDVRPQRKKKPIDRRTLKPGVKGCIPIDPVKNYVPSAPKVPDCLQVPIESSFAPVKHFFKQKMHSQGYQGYQGILRAMREAFRDHHTPELIRNCFEHGKLCMNVFSGPEGEPLEANGKIYHCTYGKWLPGELAA